LRTSDRTAHGYGVGGECTGRLTRGELLRAVGQKTLERLEARQAENSVAIAALPNLVRCPECDVAFEAAGQLQPTGHAPFRCGACNYEFCRRCRLRSHPGTLAMGCKVIFTHPCIFSIK
jgi:hypothetical protein